MAIESLTDCRGQPLLPNGPITLVVNDAGARSAVNPHAACDAAGTGDGTTARTYTGTQGETPETDKEQPTRHRASSRPYQGGPNEA